MLRSNRGIVYALGLILLAAGPSPNDRSATDHRQPAQTAERSLEQIADAQAKQTDTGEYQAPCADGEYKRESDLCAQWYAARAARDAANAAYWAVFWTIVSLGLSAVGLIALLVTIRQGREANAIAREADRAWIRIEGGPKAQIWINPNGIELKTDVVLQNFGNSPALDVWSDGFISFAKPEREGLLRDLEAKRPQERDALTILFPGVPEGGGLEFDMFDDRPESGTIYVTIFAKYKVIGCDQWHYSAFTYLTIVDDAATRLYGMVGDEMRLKFGANESRRINLELRKGRGGLPIAT